MADPRVQQYGRLIVERSLDVQPRWQVVIRTTPLARPLLEEVVRLIARRGAYALQRIGFTLWPIDDVWAREVPEDVLAEMAPIDLYTSDRMDARITIEAPENTREGSDITGSRRKAARGGARPF